jgi:hypothetical protein
MDFPRRAVNNSGSRPWLRRRSNRSRSSSDVRTRDGRGRFALDDVFGVSENGGLPSVRFIHIRSGDTDQISTESVDLPFSSVVSQHVSSDIMRSSIVQIQSSRPGGEFRFNFAERTRPMKLWVTLMFAGRIGQAILKLWTRDKGRKSSLSPPLLVPRGKSHTGRRWNLNLET